MQGEIEATRSELLRVPLAWALRVSDFWTSLTLRLVWPYAELIIRLWIAKLFFSFGVQQLMHWTAVLQISAEENPFPSLAPALSAYLGTGANLICAVLMALGLMTRYASLPLLLLAAITQVRFEPFDTQLFWIALFGWYLVHGAGPISLDNLLRRGLADSAIPFVPRAIQFSSWFRAHASPWYLTGLRVWLGVALGVACTPKALVLLGEGVERWLPLDVVARLPVPAAVAGCVALMLGLGTRVVSLVLLLTLSVFSVVDPRQSDSIYLLMLLAILIVYGGGGLSVDVWFKRWHSRFASVQRCPSRREYLAASGHCRRRFRGLALRAGPQRRQGYSNVDRPEQFPSVSAAALSGSDCRTVAGRYCHGDTANLPRYADDAPVIEYCHRNRY